MRDIVALTYRAEAAPVAQNKLYWLMSELTDVEFIGETDGKLQILHGEAVEICADWEQD